MQKFRYHKKFGDYKAGMAGISALGIVCVAIFMFCVAYINMTTEVVDFRPYVFMGLSTLGLFLTQFLWGMFWDNIGEIDTE